ncbi:hypothetical protein PHSY_001504 [Pseudozyma hubeiensis SY62]|uniref:Uncharacterized protein n=1 Tax=Pseudozyma hubeiensis (strain SY62) TaxID=1305764 RepID=R9NYZ6_PSEHS|nr:hypothetical protein PHSY_001504 [Pseudozyma hubeiensis SY62]GAC93936.1 hypothetical protein PHSY_001504 [Pseudozyma hubeiensis SY62]
MSGMPARTFREASRPHQEVAEQASNAKPRTQRESPSATSLTRMTATGPLSPNSVHKRSRDSPQVHISSFPRQDSAEEDELSDDPPSHQVRDRSSRSHRTPSTKRKHGNISTQASSPKRSRNFIADGLADQKTAEAPHVADPSSRGSSPQEPISAKSDNRQESLEHDRPSARLMSAYEVDTFLDLICKHHPEPLTPETMRQSVDALYSDWEQFCSRRQAPLRFAKKPLMDEYAKIFNGIYGTDAQDKAQSIAQELSQRSSGILAGKHAADNDRDQRLDSGSRHSGAFSNTDRETDDEGGVNENDDDDDDDNNDDDDDDDDEVDPNDVMTAADAGASDGPLLDSKTKEEKGRDASKEQRTGTGSSTKKSNIARVGRNGLAVLPPGLFDILRTHLRDDILSSIMPSVRNDLTEQTRELFLQNQDLFGRIKEMEDRIRNQDLWIRHLLARDPWEMATPSVGPHVSATGMASAEAKPMPFAASARDSVKIGRPTRQEPLPQEGGPGSAAPPTDYFGGPFPRSPRQDVRNDPRRFQQPQQGSFEGRAPAAAPTQSVVAGPFGSGRWEPEALPSRVYQDRLPPTDQRQPYANEAPFRRQGSWHSDVQPGRDLRQHPNEWHDQSEGRYELPPQGPHFRQQRLSSGDSRKLSALGAGNAAVPRGAHARPYPSDGSPPPPLSTTHDEFRRPGPPMLPRESAMSPRQPEYESRRMQPSRPVHRSEAYLSSGEALNASLPPRTMAAGSPEQMQRNKRGRPSKAEMANSGVSFGTGSHASAPSRSYLS